MLFIKLVVSPDRLAYSLTFMNTDLGTYLQNANRSLRQKDGEVQETHTKITFLTEEVSRLKKQVESSQVITILLSLTLLN